MPGLPKISTCVEYHALIDTRWEVARLLAGSLSGRRGHLMKVDLRSAMYAEGEQGVGAPGAKTWPARTSRPQPRP